MQSQQLLRTQPSVQALAISSQGVNPGKAALHHEMINSGNFVHDPTTISGKRTATTAAGGHAVVVVRNEQNLRRAAAARTKPATPRLGFQSAKAALVTQPEAPSPQRSVRAGSDVAAALPPLVARTTERPPLHDGPKMARKPSTLKRPALSRASLVSSQQSVSVTSSLCESCSCYTCSCCHPRPPSKASSLLDPCPSIHSSGSSVPASAYDNLSSVSQRAARREQALSLLRRKAGATGSSFSGLTMASSKVRDLEAELDAERHERQRAQAELAAVRARQDALLKKLRLGTVKPGHGHDVTLGCDNNGGGDVEALTTTTAV